MGVGQWSMNNVYNSVYNSIPALGKTQISSISETAMILFWLIIGGV